MVVLESQNVSGGVMNGTEIDGFSFDYCVSEMMLKSERMESLLAEMGLAVKLREADKNAEKRYIVRRGNFLYGGI